MTAGARLQRLARRVAGSIALVGLGLLALLATLLGALLVWRDAVLDSAPVREYVERALYEQTGRNVTLTGAIRLPGFAASGFPWLQIEVGAGVIDNPEGFEGPPLFRWESIRFDIDIASLREELPRLGPIDIDGYTLEIGYDAEGRDNFSDIGPLVESPPATRDWVIPGLSLRNGEVLYFDRTFDPAVELRFGQAQLQLGQLTNGALDRSAIWDVATLSYSGTLQSSLFGTAANASPAPVQLPFRLAAPALQLDLGNALLGANRLQLQLGSANIQLADFELTFAEEQPLRLSTAIELGELALPDWLASLGYALPTAAKQARGNTTLLNLASLRASTTVIVDELTTRLQLDDLVLRLDESTVEGRIHIDADYDLDLRIDRLDVDRYLPLVGAEASGPTDDPRVVLEETLESLREWPINGTLRFTELRAAGNRLRGVKVVLESRIDSIKKQ